MANAKKELIEVLEKINGTIKCATIYEYEHDSETKQLPQLHTKEQEIKFFESLDFNYNSGYCGQNLFGTVWLTDGTWLERGEYDGSEWWDHKQCPTIPDNL